MFITYHILPQMYLLKNIFFYYVWKYKEDKHTIWYKQFKYPVHMFLNCSMSAPSDYD
jgi:hypothetical protein